MANNRQPRSQKGQRRPDPRDERIAELEAQLAHAQTVIAELEKQNAQLQEQMAEVVEQAAQQQQRIAELVEQVAQQQQRIAELERAGKRQATPFVRKKRKANLQKPAPEEINETKEAPLDSCPECGGELTERKTHEQFMVDIPPVEPVITRFVAHNRYCGHWCKRTRSRHPE